MNFTVYCQHNKIFTTVDVSHFQTLSRKNNKPTTGERVNNYKFVQVLVTAKVRAGGKRVLSIQGPQNATHIPLAALMPCGCSTVLSMPACALSQGSSRDPHSSDHMAPLPCGVNPEAFEANSPSAHLCCASSPNHPEGMIPKSRFWG